MLPNHLLQERLSALLRERQLPSAPENLYRPIEYFMGIGGKRIRPLLCLVGCQMFSDEVEKAFAPALAVEYFHNFSLLHDDVMDHAPLRRGVETVHVKYGLNVAILSGDAMLVKAYQYLSESETGLSDLVRLFTKTALEVCEGQQYDMDFETRNDVSIAEYLLMIELKTAVLLAAALGMGAIVGGASAVDVEHLYGFGKNIGIAFQLQDDLLDTFGNPESFGKQVGGDILQNKKTYLLLKALETADVGRLERLSYWMNADVDAPDVKVREVKSIFESLHIQEATEAIIQTYYQEAFSLLNKINVEQIRKQPLVELAEQLMFRQF